MKKKIDRKAESVKRLNETITKRLNEQMDAKAKRDSLGMKIGFGAFLALVTIILFSAFVVKVPAGHVGIMFDKLSGGVQLEEFNGGNEGWGLKIPIVQQVYKLDARTQTLEYLADNAVTPKDFNGVNFKWDIVVRFKLDRQQAAEVYKNKGTDYASKIIGTALRSRAREVLGNYSQEEVQKNRLKIAEEIKEAVQKRVNEETDNVPELNHGFLLIEAIDLRDLNYHDQIEAAIVSKQEALVFAEKQVYKLQQAVKEKEIVETMAEAQRNKQILEAEGKSQAILLEATAKAEGIQKINDAYQAMPPAFVSTKWAEAIKDNDKLIFGLENLGGSGLLPILDINEVAALKTTGKITDAEE